MKVRDIQKAITQFRITTSYKQKNVKAKVYTTDGIFDVTDIQFTSDNKEMIIYIYEDGEKNNEHKS